MSKRECDPQSQGKGTSSCGNDLAIPYFVSFIFFCSFLVCALPFSDRAHQWRSWKIFRGEQKQVAFGWKSIGGLQGQSHSEGSLGGGRSAPKADDFTLK